MTEPIEPMPNLNKYINDLPENTGGTSLDGNEVFEIQKGTGTGSSQRLTLTNLATKVKGFIASAFATSEQGAKADSAVQSLVAGDNITIDATDPHNPVINGSGGVIQSLVAGDNVTIDGTDPANPIISATGGGGGSSGATWELLAKYSFSTDGIAQTLEADVSDYSEIFLVSEGVTASASGYRMVQISSDAGATWETSYNYANSSGALATSIYAGMGMHASPSSSAIYGTARMSLLEEGRTPVLTPNNMPAAPWLVTSSSPINRVRICVLPSSGSTLLNMTGGKAYIFGIRKSAAGTGNLSAAILADSPRAYYTLEAATISGTTVTDRSGNGHDATLPSGAVVGASALVPTDSSGRYPYLGTEQCSVADQLGLAPPLSTSYTICLAIFSGGGSYGLAGVSAGFILNAFGATGETEATNWSAIHPSTGDTTSAYEVFWEYASGANTIINIPLIALNGSAVLIHLVKDSVAKTVTMYCNGKFIGRGAYANEPTGGTPGPIRFGGGLCGHWAYFDSALTADRVAAHAAAGGFA